MKSQPRSAFTLIELLMVLGVMSILMSLLIPSVGVVREKAQRMATAQKMRQIALGVATYQSVTSRSLSGADLGDWMSRLGQQTGLRETKLFVFDEDPLLANLNQSMPPVLVQPGDNGRWRPVDGFEDWPIGVAVASGLSPHSPPSTTPVAWTRGLTPDGVWQPAGAARPGVYGAAGGFIAFLDGHVEFFTDLGLDGGQLVHYSDGTRTADIREAIGPGVVVYDYIGQVF